MLLYVFVGGHIVENQIRVKASEADHEEHESETENSQNQHHWVIGESFPNGEVVHLTSIN